MLSPRQTSSVWRWFLPECDTSFTDGHALASKPVSRKLARHSAVFPHPTRWEGTMAGTDEMKIVLQVGTELRVTNEGEVILSNPELELAREDRAADAVLFYRFNS